MRAKSKTDSVVNLRKIMILGILFWLELFSSKAALAEEIIIKYESPTRLKLTRYHINHIHFDLSKVKKIVGYKNLYQTILSNNKQDLYLRLNPEELEPINISVIDTAGRVFDFELMQIERRTPLSVKILQDRSSHLKLKRNIELEISKMLTAMKSGMVGKYYVLNPEKRFKYGKLGKRVGLKIVKDYRYQNLRGLGIEIINLNKKAITIAPRRDIDGFNGKIVSGFNEKIIIKPKNREVVYLVVDREEV